MPKNVQDGMVAGRVQPGPTGHAGSVGDSCMCRERPRQCHHQRDKRCAANHRHAERRRSRGALPLHCRCKQCRPCCGRRVGSRARRETRGLSVPAPDSARQFLARQLKKPVAKRAVHHHVTQEWAHECTGVTRLQGATYAVASRSPAPAAPSSPSASFLSEAVTRHHARDLANRGGANTVKGGGLRWKTARRRCREWFRVPGVGQRNKGCHR